MENINEILVKHFEGMISPAEEAVLEEWKSLNRKEYEVLKKAWTGTTLEEAPIRFDTGRAWEQVSDKALGTSQVIALPGRRKLLYRIAASFLLLISVIALWRVLSPSGTGASELVFLNPDQAVKELVLPDGSLISLKQNARLVYYEGTAEQRRMELSGEAFFEVTRDTARPFMIETPQATVTVLGTSFNVESSDSASTVSVRTGQVRLSAPVGTLLLNAGQMAVSTELRLSEIKENDLNYLSWKTGEFVFENASLPDMIRQLNKYYANRFGYEKESDCRITARFKNNSAEEIGQIIQMICGNEVEQRGDKILFR
jgi:transmembrane sensor